MPVPSIIAIDGPAASGKSTLAQQLAQLLNYLYFDTGIMYRAVTWAVLQHGLALDDEAAITSLAEHADIDVRPASVEDGRLNDVLVAQQDVTWAIRSPEVEANVSRVSAYPGVRRALTVHQRRIGQRGRVVMVGRDIGTVVLPNADLKIYLDASAEQRARRRHAELASAVEQHGRSEPADYEEILAAMRERDRIDSTRQVAPLRPAPDARILDSDQLDATQVLELVKRWVYDSSASEPDPTLPSANQRSIGTP